MHLDATCNLVLVSRMLRSLHYLSCGWVVGWLGGWVGVDTEINAKPAQAEAGVGAGAELGKIHVHAGVTYRACIILPLQHFS